MKRPRVSAVTERRGAASTFAAVDLGASGGRVLAGRWNGARFDITEIHRFPNGPVDLLGRLHWNVLGLWQELKVGLKRCGSSLESVGVDTWGVDFALLDRSGELLGNPHHYRDHRTDGIMDKVFDAVPPARIYARTGIQFMPINTLYQLYSLKLARDPRLTCADTLLLMGDLFHYWLSGVRACEYTNASTSQLLNAETRRWDTALMGEFGFDPDLFPEVVSPGTVLGPLAPSVARELGTTLRVVAPATHDTASAVAAIPGLNEQQLFISSGTWSLVGVEVREPVLSEAARALNVTNEGGVAGTIRLLKNVAGLWLLQACQQSWRRAGRDYGWEEILERARNAAPFRAFVDPGAATFLNPDDMPEAVRDYCRRTGQPLPEEDGEVARCCLESLALKYRSVLDELEGLLGRRLTRICIVGGGSRNTLLNQFTADACQREVVAGPVEATALGNLVIQAMATGHLANLGEGREAVAASVTQRSHEPRDAAAWEAAYARFRTLLERKAP